MTTIESAVRAMTKTQRVEYLREHGWTRIGYSGAQCWRHPDEDDHGFYTLAAAIRCELAGGGPPPWIELSRQARLVRF